MYVFRKAGFKLYNGNEFNRDNQGYKRDFLIQDDRIENIQEKTVNYLKNFEMPEGYAKWDDVFDAIEKELNNIISKKYTVIEDNDKITLSMLCELNEEAGYDLWNHRVNNCPEKSDIKIRIIKEKNVDQICKELLAKGIAVKDLNMAGISPISVGDLCEYINDGKLDRCVISKFGHYLDQGPLTILSIKNYDMFHNKIGDLPLDFDVNEKSKGEGFCFWSVRRLGGCAERVSNFLSCNGTSKEPVYIIMPYTPSKKYKNFSDKMEKAEKIYEKVNRHDGETMDEFLVRMKKDAENSSVHCNSFKLGHKGKSKEYDLPESMFPIVMEKTEKIYALVISEIRYLDAFYQNTKDLYNYFYSETTKYRNEASNTFNSKVSHMCVSLMDNAEYNKKTFVKYLKDNADKCNDSASLFIAKLEYPYVIAISEK